MASLADIRAQYPQYNDMGDSDLANALYQKFYSDMPRQQFDAKIGLTTSGQLGQNINPMAVTKPHGVGNLGNPVLPLHPEQPPADDMGGMAAFARGGLEGIPIIGKPISDWTTDLANHLGAAIHGVPVGEMQAINALREHDTAEAHPAATGAGNLTGGVLGYGSAAAAAPALFGAGAASLPIRAGISGLTNAGIAGGDTAIRGGSGNDILQSAGAGATLGLAAPVAGAMVGGFARPIARTFSNWFGAPAVPGMGRAAANTLSDALMTDHAVQNVPARLQNLGPEAMLLDAGPSTQGQAIGLSKDIGAPRTKIVGAVSAREAGADPRLQAGMTQSFGPVQNPETVDAALKAQRGLVHDEIDPALNAAGPVNITQALATIATGLDKTVGPENAALQKVRNLLTEEVAVPAMVNGRQVFQNIRVPITDPFKVQSAKKGISDLIQYGDSSIGVAPGMLASNQGAFKMLRGQVDQALRTQVARYGNIMDRSSALAKQIDQIPAGQSVLDAGKGAIRPDTLATEWPTLPAGEQAAKQVGTRSEIDRALGQNRNDRAAVAKVLGGEGDWNRAKLATMYGQQPTDEAIRLANAEAAFQQAHRDIVRPAQTAAGLRSAQTMNPKLDAGGTHSGLLAATLGGPKEAAIYAALRGLQKGWQGLRGGALATRNNQLADALISHDPALAGALMQRGTYRATAGQPTANALSAAVRTGIGYEGAVDKGKHAPSIDDLRKALLALPVVGAYAAAGHL